MCDSHFSHVSTWIKSYSNNYNIYNTQDVCDAINTNAKKNVIAINFDQHFTKYKGKTSKHYGVELPDLKAYSTWSWSTKYKNEKKPNGKNEIIVYRKPLPTNMINIPVSAKIQICKENTFQKENYKPDVVKKPLKFTNMANEHKKRCKLKKDVN